MSSSYCKVILLGRLDQSPRSIKTDAGVSVCEFFCVTERYFVSKGEKQVREERHRIATYGKLADDCFEGLDVGSVVHIDGDLRTREWKDANGMTHYTTEVVAARVSFLSTKGK